MSDREVSKPFRNLGVKIRQARVRVQESVADVSGALEIDASTLVKIESGEQRPTEDILSLLISYLDINDNEAARLYELAGYNAGHNSNSSGSETETMQTFAALMPMDLRVVYTDGIYVAKNEAGVVMNFMQSSGFGQPLAIARVGMSKNQAQRVLDLLQKTLNSPDKVSTTKSLPPGSYASKESKA